MSIAMVAYTQMLIEAMLNLPSYSGALFMYYERPEPHYTVKSLEYIIMHERMDLNKNPPDYTYLLTKLSINDADALMYNMRSKSTEILKLTCYLRYGTYKPEELFERALDYDDEIVSMLMIMLSGYKYTSMVRLFGLPRLYSILSEKTMRRDFSRNVRVSVQQVLARPLFPWDPEEITKNSHLDDDEVFDNIDQPPFNKKYLMMRSSCSIRYYPKSPTIEQAADFAVRLNIDIQTLRKWNYPKLYICLNSHNTAYDIVYGPHSLGYNTIMKNHNFLQALSHNPDIADLMHPLLNYADRPEEYITVTKLIIDALPKIIKAGEDEVFYEDA